MKILVGIRFLIKLILVSAIIGFALGFYLAQRAHPPLPIDGGPASSQVNPHAGYGMILRPIGLMRPSRLSVRA